MEDWEAANRRHHVLAVDPDADPAAREAAAREAKKAADRVTLHKSEQASALFDMIRQAIMINPGILADRIDVATRERNRKLRKRLVAHGANAVGCDPANFALPGLAVLAAAVGNATRGTYRRS